MKLRINSHPPWFWNRQEISSHTLLGMRLLTHVPVASVQYDVMTWKWLPHNDDVIKWKHFSRYWPFVRGIHLSPVNSPHKGQWRGALMFSLICAWINGWVNIVEAGDLRRHRAHYDVTVMITGPFERNPLVNDGSPSQTNSNAEPICCFLCCQSIQAIEQTVELLVNWDVMVFISRHCNGGWNKMRQHMLTECTLLNNSWKLVTREHTLLYLPQRKPKRISITQCPCLLLCTMLYFAGGNTNKYVIGSKSQLNSTQLKRCFTNMDIQYWLIAIWGWLPHRFIWSIVTGFRKWWLHQMVTFSTLLALLCGNSPIASEFPSQRPLGYGVFFDLRLNKPLSK